tara:strand:- start:1378 stop:1980 length:603 start_codon:yes stop_codon:yes gene_type:complete
MNKRNFIILFLIFLSITASLAYYLGVRLSYNSGDVDFYANVGGDFTLRSEFRSVSLSDFQGKVVLLFFGFTSCPDYCPTELARIASAIRTLSENERNQTQVLFVTIDPERDTIEKVSQYTKFFHPNILGLVGTPEQVRDVAHKFFVFYEIVKDPDSDIAYTIDHTLTTFLIARDGRVKKLIDKHWTSTQLADAVRVALRD